ncbi:MAG: 1-acyl-sn-glycerol-3-phosphate acyltransferase [Acidimicrobiales bacterium]
MLADTTDPVEIEQRYERQYAGDEWYRHLYRTSYAYHGVHPFYMWYWGSHGLQHAGKVIIVGGDVRAVRRLGFTPASTLQDALEMATDVVGPQPTITHVHNPPIRRMADVTSLPGRNSPSAFPINPRRSPVARAAGRRSLASTMARVPFPARPDGPRRRRTGASAVQARRRVRHRLGPPLPRPPGVVLVEGAVRPAAHAIARPMVGGADRVADYEGPAIFAANHHSHIDTGLLLSTIPEPWRHKLVIGAAADYFFGNRVTAAERPAIGAIPIERTRVSRRSVDDAAALIDDGWSFLIFPEGGRSPDGWGQEFRGGAAYLSLRCGVPVVPVHLAGTGRILPKGTNVPKPGPTRVTFGHPLWPTPDEDSRRFAARLEQTIAALADEARTDWWSARRRAHTSSTPSLSGPEVGAWRRTWALGDRTAARRRAARAWPKL